MVSNLMDASSASEWKKLQMNGSAGAANLLNKWEAFGKEAFCRIEYTNTTTPFSFVKATKNISKSRSLNAIKLHIRLEIKSLRVPNN